MVKKGDIIKISFNPIHGHEQGGYRPAVVISNKDYNRYTNLVILCPITNTENDFPLHVPLDSRTNTTGVILCEHVKSFDINARSFKYVEALPKDILDIVISIIKAEI
jgi:mRNA interferase MazF